MLPARRIRSRQFLLFASFALLPLALAGILVSCGGVNYGMSGGTGAIHVSLTDPPSCMFPAGNFKHVYMSIRSVQAHVDATAGDNSSGWQELAPQLNSQPMQIDLFSTASSTCLLTTLGSNMALPAGTYQQIRLLLVSNSGSPGPVPTTNNCGSQGYNCVVLSDDTVHELNLSSQANTGLKIPPGQVMGGPIMVGAGQDVNLDIDFNACASIILEGNGRYRLKPALTAQQVGTSNTGISGQVVDASTNLPIVGGKTIVAIETKDATGTDTIFMQSATDSAGNFNFCPLPSGMTFDVLAVAVNGAGVGYNATVTVGVPGGTNLGAIPLIAETGTSPGPTAFHGWVTVTTGSAPASVDVLVSAIQNVPLSGGGTLPVTIPPEATPTADSGANLSLDSATDCPPSPPANANCASYTLIEPASNPSVGMFSAGKMTAYSAPLAGDVLYSIRANAFVPLSGGASDCMPNVATVTQDSSANPLKAVPGGNVTPATISFTGCS